MGGHPTLRLTLVLLLLVAACGLGYRVEIANGTDHPVRVVDLEAGSVIAPRLKPGESVTLSSCRDTVEARTMTGDAIARYHDSLCQGGVRWTIGEGISTLD